MKAIARNEDAKVAIKRILRGLFDKMAIIVTFHIQESREAALKRDMLVFAIFIICAIIASISTSIPHISV
jgi:hypothetical protein